MAYDVEFVFGSDVNNRHAYPARGSILAMIAIDTFTVFVPGSTTTDPTPYAKLSYSNTAYNMTASLSAPTRTVAVIITTEVVVLMGGSLII